MSPVNASSAALLDTLVAAAASAAALLPRTVPASTGAVTRAFAGATTRRCFARANCEASSSQSPSAATAACAGPAAAAELEVVVDAPEHGVEHDVGEADEGEAATDGHRLPETSSRDEVAPEPTDEVTTYLNLGIPDSAARLPIAGEAIGTAQQGADLTAALTCHGMGHDSCSTTTWPEGHPLFATGHP